MAGPSISEILKLRGKYSNLLTKKTENIQKIINDSGKSKLHIKMTTRYPSCKQIIISMSKEDTNKFIASFSSYIANINRALKNIKSDAMTDYVQQESIGVIIVTNKVALSFNLQVIKNFIKNVEIINFKDIESSWLNQNSI